MPWWCAALLFVACGLSPTRSQSVGYYVKTAHVSQVVHRYLTLSDSDLRGMLKTGYDPTMFRYQLHQLHESMEVLDSKISPYFEKLSKPLFGVTKEKILWDWIESSGGKVAGVDLLPVETFGRGLIASRTYLKGDDVVLIDRKCVMRFAQGYRASQKIRKLYAEWTSPSSLNYMAGQTHQTMEKVLLSVFLLEEVAKGPSSFFYPYIQLLPQDVAYSPIVWDEAKDEELFQGSHMVRALQQRRKEYRYEYSRGILKVVPEYTDLFSVERFQWARLIVATRAFRIYMNGALTETEKSTKTENAIIALVPVADLANHRDNAQTEWTYDVNRDAFSMTTTAKIKTGGQVFDSYGHKNNFDFLINFGFTLPNSRNVLYFFVLEVDFLGIEDIMHERTTVRIGAVPSWSATEETRVQTLANPTDGFLKKSILSKSIDHALLGVISFVRGRAHQDLHKIKTPHDRTMEYALLVLRGRLRKMKQSYSTTAEEDAKQLTAMESIESSPEKFYIHAIRLRRNEKLIIRWLLDLIERNLRAFQNFPDASRLVIQDMTVAGSGEIIVSGDHLKSVDKESIRVGSELLGKWNQGRTYYEATVVTVHDDGTADLCYWDGDKEMGVPLHRLAWFRDFHIRRRYRKAQTDNIVEERVQKLLQNDCFQFQAKADYWSYELCPGIKALQFHAEKDGGKRSQSISLGFYDKRSKDIVKDDPLAPDAYEEWYTRGGDGRVATVQYVCAPSASRALREKGALERALVNQEGKASADKELHYPPFQKSDNRIINVTEPSEMSYIFTFATPLACIFDTLKAGSIAKKPWANFFNDPTRTGVKVGDFGHARIRNQKKSSASGYNAGHITAVNGDGSVAFQYDNGVFEDKVLIQDIILEMHK